MRHSFIHYVQPTTHRDRLTRKVIDTCQHVWCDVACAWRRWRSSAMLWAQFVRFLFSSQNVKKREFDLVERAYALIVRFSFVLSQSATDTQCNEIRNLMAMTTSTLYLCSRSNTTDTHQPKPQTHAYPQLFGTQIQICFCFTRLRARKKIHLSSECRAPRNANNSRVNRRHRRRLTLSFAYRTALFVYDYVIFSIFFFFFILAAVSSTHSPACTAGITVVGGADYWLIHTYGTQYTYTCKHKADQCVNGAHYVLIINLSHNGIEAPTRET